MKYINLDEYKEYLVSKYVYKCDDDEYQIKKRKNILESKYKDEYLESIILGTYNFINKILEISSINYFGYINIPLEIEPNVIYINLGLTGGWMSDTVVKDSNNNFYSIGILKMVFGSSLQIEPCRIDITEEFDCDNDFDILSEVQSYYLYIQCKKEIIDNIKDEWTENNNMTKVLKISNK